MRVIPLDDYNREPHPGIECLGSVTTTWGNMALRNGWKLIEVYEQDSDSGEDRETSAG